MRLCEICNKELLKRHKRFCSRKCRDIGSSIDSKGQSRSSSTQFKKGHKPHNYGTRKEVILFCQECGIEFIWHSKLNTSGKYCSSVCYYKHNRKENHPNYNGGTTKMSNGYIRDNMTKKYQHRLIAEEVLERSLMPGEVVHHINGNKSDNRNSNLLICSDEYHRWLHNQMSIKYMKEHFK